MKKLPTAHPTVAEAHAWLTGWGDQMHGLDNGEKLYGHDAALLDAYRRGADASRTRDEAVLRP